MLFSRCLPTTSQLKECHKMALFCSSSILTKHPIGISCGARLSTLHRRTTQGQVVVTAMAIPQPQKAEDSTKLVTFLGKGDSGKTTSAVFAAQLLLEPLNPQKQADARLNMTQGVLEKIVGEELGVLPLYLKYMRIMAEKTDLGRLAGHSILRLVDEAMEISDSPSLLNGQISSEIRDALDQMLEVNSNSHFLESQFCLKSNFASLWLYVVRRLRTPKVWCFLVMDPDNQISVNSALRYWGCAIQSGAHVSGALGIASPHSNPKSMERIRETFSPLPFGFIPHLSISSAIDWNAIMLNTVNESVRNLLSMPASGCSSKISPVEFDAAKKTVTLLMPGFDKSEIKLYQYRGGSELLMEAGDQR